MDVGAVLLELYQRIPPLAHEAVDGLDVERLVTPPAAGANTVAWLVWHLARVQDHHGSELLGADQVWSGGEWAARFGLDADPSNTGYGHSVDDVLAVRPDSTELLTDYLDAVQRRTETFIGGLSSGDLDRMVDRSWDPPVTLGVRLISVADDSLQHAGQAAYVRGLLLG